MRAVVLAGGLGTRLAPLTTDLPKPLVPVLNYPIIGRVLTALRRAGIHDIGITVTPHAEQIRRYIGTGRDLGLQVTWLEDEAVVGTGGSLRDHASFFRGEPALVVTADMLSDIDPAAVVAHHHAHSATVTVAAHPVDLATWPGDILHTDGHRGLAYQFKPGPDRALSNLGSGGIWVVDPAILGIIPAHGLVDFSQDVLPSLPGRGRTLGVYNAGHTRIRDFGQFDTYHQGNLEALRGQHGITPAGTIVGPGIWIEQDTQVHPTATLTSPLAIGRAVTVGAYARLVGPTIIGHGAHIGPRAALLRSVVLPGAAIPPDTLVANAVTGEPGEVVKHLFAQP